MTKVKLILFIVAVAFVEKCNSRYDDFSQHHSSDVIKIGE